MRRFDVCQVVQESRDDLPCPGVALAPLVEQRHTSSTFHSAAMSPIIVPPRRTARAGRDADRTRARSSDAPRRWD
jgi:hypothetical protein